MIKTGENGHYSLEDRIELFKLIDNLLRTGATKLDVSVDEFIIILQMTIAENDAGEGKPPTLNAIARRFGISRQTLDRRIDHLVERGIYERYLEGKRVSTRVRPRIDQEIRLTTVDMIADVDAYIRGVEARAERADPYYDDAEDLPGEAAALDDSVPSASRLAKQR
jgi:AraC-like DNA-binding protein